MIVEDWKPVSACARRLRTLNHRGQQVDAESLSRILQDSAQQQIGSCERYIPYMCIRIGLGVYDTRRG